MIVRGAVASGPETRRRCDSRLPSSRRVIRTHPPSGRPSCTYASARSLDRSAEPTTSSALGRSSAGTSPITAAATSAAEAALSSMSRVCSVTWCATGSRRSRVNVRTVLADDSQLRRRRSAAKPVVIRSTPTKIVTRSLIFWGNMAGLCSAAAPSGRWTVGSFLWKGPVRPRGASPGKRRGRWDGSYRWGGVGGLGSLPRGGEGAEGRVERGGGGVRWPQ